MKKLITISLLSAAFVMTTSCYRMPDENHYSTIPITNNPHMVPQKGGSMPGMNY